MTKKNQDPQRIVRIEGENVKRMKAFAVDVSGEDCITIGGENGAGKSSLIDAVMYALSGSRALGDKPLRTGASKGYAKVETSAGLIWMRTFNDKGKTKLEIRGPDGAKYTITKLEHLVGKLSFDPTAFARMDPKDQVEALLDLTGRRDELDQIAAKRKAAYDKRTDVNRKLRDLKGTLAEREAPGDDVPDEEVSAAEILAEQQKAQAVVDANRKARHELEDLEQQKANLDRGIESAQANITDLEERLAEARAFLERGEAKRTDHLKTLAKKRKEVKALQDPDLSEFITALGEVEETNRAIRAKQGYHELEAAIEMQEEDVQTLTDEIKTHDDSKAKILAAAELPIEGLSFDESGITYKGEPFSQASQAETIQVSTAIGIAMNPALRVMFIRDGGLCTAKTLRMIRGIAKQHEVQLFVEDPRATDEEATIIIEEGEVVKGGGYDG